MTKLERELSALKYLDAGCSREEWVRIGMSAKAAGLSFEDFHAWSKDAPNYSGEKDCLTAWKSFDEIGDITAATIFHKAHARGWQDTNKIRTNSANNNWNRNQNKKQFDKVITNKHANEIWDKCLPAPPSHEYIQRKHGKPDGLRIYPSGVPPLIISGQNVTDYLVIPCWSDEKLQTLQFIPPNKDVKKLNLNKSTFNDGYFSIGLTSERIYICEGLGQAWAVNKASEAAAVVCFGAGRMMTVAKVLRNKYPKARLVIVSDRGKEKQASDIATSVYGQLIEMPETKPSNYDANDFAQEFGYDALASLLSCPKIPVMRYKLLSAIDLFNTPAMTWMVQGLIPAIGLAALYGASGCGKSFLVLDIALAIAGGEEHWFGLRVTKAPVTYIYLEGELGISKRVKAWSIYHNKPVPDELRFVAQPFNLLSDDVSELASAVNSIGGFGGLIIIDTLNRAAPGADENSSVDMGNIIASAKKLQGLTGGVVLLVHHTGKDSTRGLRGHSSLYAALDGAVEVIKTDRRREWSIAKSKDDVTGNSNPFKLEIVKVGLDDQGNEETSCVALFDSSDLATIQ